MPNGNVGTFKRAVDLTRTFTEFAAQYANLNLKPQHLRRLYEEQKRDKLYLSEYYQVAINKEAKHGFGNLRMWWLSIKRLDKEPIMDWRDLQAIKTQLCGAEAEGMQLFPAESRVVDTANQYHIWVFMPSNKDGPFPIVPLGWPSRQVRDNDTSDPHHVPNAKQRPINPQG